MLEFVFDYLQFRDLVLLEINSNPYLIHLGDEKSEVACLGNCKLTLDTLDS